MNKIETIKLENGLTIYLLHDKRRHSTFFQFTTFCGGITKHFKVDNKEYFLPDGIAHILEHYIVECNEQGNFLEELGKLQMTTNASTTPTTTSYYFETVENACKGIETILKGIYSITFTKEKLEKLKNPIYQEIRGKLDNKFYYLNRKRMENLFTNVDYRDVGGNIEEIKNVTIEDLEILYNAFYKPTNQFITIAGNFDKDKVLKTIKDFYKKITLTKYKTEIILPEENYKIKKTEDSFSFPTPQEYIDLTFKLSKKGYTNEELLDLDFYIQSYLGSAFGPTSKIYQELVNEKIILESIQCSISQLYDYIIISIGGYTNNKELLKERILTELKEKQSLNKEKFELDKKSATIRLILRDENIFKMIGPFLNNVIYYDYPYLDKLEDIDKLTFEEYTEKIKELDFNCYTYTIIYNKKNSTTE